MKAAKVTLFVFTGAPVPVTLFVFTCAPVPVTARVHTPQMFVNQKRAYTYIFHIWRGGRHPRRGLDTDI
eukprot:574171-Prorocentrum_minimum.AAC.1